MEENAINVVVDEKVPRDYSRLKTYLLQYGISLIICVGLFFFTLYMRGYYDNPGDMSPGELKNWETMRLNAIADGFTVPGVIFTCLGLLIFVSNRNFFKGTKYALIKTLAFIMPFSQKLQDKKYSDMDDVKKVKYYSFLFIIGVVLILVAIIFILVNHLY